MQISKNNMNGIDESLRISWIWILSSGLMILFLGVLAFGNLALTTTVSVFYVGIFMMLGGIIQFIHAFQFNKSSSFFYFLFSGLVYTSAGIIAFENPLLAAATLTLLLAFSLIASGIIRISSSFQLSKQFGSGWILSSGLLTLVAGIIFMINWSINSLWLLGTVLALDLTFLGVSTIMLALNLKNTRMRSLPYNRTIDSMI